MTTVLNPYRPLIAVIGATGAQGGSVVRALLEKGHYRVRALTRKPFSADGWLLQGLGAEVVEADLDRPETLRAALAGAHGVFAMTNHFEHGSPERELAQAGHLAGAARDAKVAHVVWSTMEDTRRWVSRADPRFATPGGRWNVPSFDAKGAANALFFERGVPTTLLHLSFFWENLIGGGMQPERLADGRLMFTLPMGDRPLPGISVKDVGPIVRALFERGTWSIGRSFGVAADHLSGEQMAAKLSRALGETVLHHSPSFAECAAESAAAWRFQHDFHQEFCARRSVADTRSFHPGLMDFDAWLARHAQDIPLAPRALRRAA